MNHQFSIPNEKKMNVIINTDAKNEVDDQFAIVHALLTPSFDIKGIIPAHFGDRKSKTSLKDSHDETILLLDYLGLKETVTVADGANKAIENPLTPVDSPGARLIIDEALKANQDPLYIAFYGPLTDMASALLLEPAIEKCNIKVVWIGGGNWPEGSREYNLSNDIHAANVVFKSTLEVWQISRPVYRQMPVSFAELYERVYPFGPLGKYLAKEVIDFNNESPSRPTEYRILGDSPAVGVIMFPDCGRWSMKPAPEFAEDMTYIHTGNNRDIRVYETIDARFILEDFYAKLAQFDRNTSNKPWSVRMANSIMKIRPTLRDRWAYDYGVLCKGMEAVYKKTKDYKYFDYIESNMNHFINPRGEIRYYNQSDYNIDYINNGKTLLYLYKETGNLQYKLAADLLRKQLKNHPRTKEGGFWHKKRYPHQMWLDGLYMGSPFYAEYIQSFESKLGYSDVIKQFTLMEKHSRNPETGLLYHGWDESKKQSWADDETGCSPNFWGRAMGWFTMALVDVLDFIPKSHPERHKLIEILNRLCTAIEKYQNPENGLWYQVLDQQQKEGNYPESSASCMFTYGLAKASRLGYVPDYFKNTAIKGMEGIIEHFIQERKDGLINLTDTVYVSGLGGEPYRDGSFEYYISEPREMNNLLGIGAFIQAAVELES